MTDSRTAPADQPTLDVSHAPLPTIKTTRRRRALAFQFVRFMAFNARIMRMVVKGHKGAATHAR